MKKSKIFIIVSLVFIISIFISCYLIYNSLFPKAPPIELPSLDQDIKMIFEYPDGTVDEILHENTFTGHSRFLGNLMRAKPTRIMSVNDYPAGEEYTKISFVCSDKTYTYYLYEKNGTTYVEVPYEGVYVID